MAKYAANHHVVDLQPDELNSLKSLVQDFMNKVSLIDHEIEQLKLDRKDLLEEYSNKLDMKTLNAVLRVIKIQRGVQHKDTYDLFLSALTE